MDNQVEWIMIKKISKKENRKRLRKLIIQSILVFVLTYCTVVFGLQLIPIIWKSDLLQNAAEWLRYLVK